MSRKSSNLQVQERNPNTKVAAEPTAQQSLFRRPAAFTPFTSLRREMDDLFSDFSERFSGINEGQHVPALDVTETDDAYEIRAELPGVDETDIDITATGNRLTICGEKEQNAYTEDADSRIAECSYGHYERSVRLPAEFETDAIRAEYKNGVLQMNVPKAQPAPAKTKKVKITSLKK